MTLSRRILLAGLAIPAIPEYLAAQQKTGMYGLIGSMKATSGKRDELAAILLAGTGDMPGCLSYVVAADPADPDTLWITEVWDSAASHQASLSLPAVRSAIAKGRPLIAVMGEYHATEPIGGYGIRRG